MFVITRTLDPCDGVKKSKQFFFSETSHVTYQIKDNDTHDNMQAYILPLHTPTWVGFKGQNIISSKSMLNTKMNMKFWSCTYHGHLSHGWVGELGVL